MGIACVPHLPQKIFSHFLCEGLCHAMGLGLSFCHFIGVYLGIGLCHSHGIDHFIGLGLSFCHFIGIGLSLCHVIGLSLSLCHFIDLCLGLCLGLKRKNSAEAELISKH